MKNTSWHKSTCASQDKARRDPCNCQSNAEQEMKRVPADYQLPGETFAQFKARIGESPAAPAPLDLAFNAAVMTMARKVCPTGYDVAHDGSAPESLPALQDHIARTRRILVDGRNSDATIFACPEHNWAFRTWHDWTHWVLSAPFTLDGELSVANRQIEDLKRVYGHGAQVQRWAELIMCEVYGQALFFEHFGHFPPDQRTFATRYLDSGMSSYIDHVVCPQCHGKDEWCTLCEGNGVVTPCQDAEYRACYPDASLPYPDDEPPCATCGEYGHECERE